ncbi:hypothetical protein [Tardiphaga sp. P9-11]|uniref:hypothetical protein n=1 Tax=Tardiphaga sp. P9-11 TaxID=2024614 RepID=UPI0011F3CDAE|nr:hypothetical protein [Tardiphaga sp. P9-11]
MAWFDRVGCLSANVAHISSVVSVFLFGHSQAFLFRFGFGGGGWGVDQNIMSSMICRSDVSMQSAVKTSGSRQYRPMRAITGTSDALSSNDNPFIEMAHEIVRRYLDLNGNVGWYNHDGIPCCRSVHRLFSE